jgi:polysaccharide transporter, PST family
LPLKRNINKTLFENATALTILKLFEYALPLLTLPYLVSKLGVEYFGEISFATAFVSYFVVITSYGFDLTATKSISIQKDNKTEVDKIYSSVFLVKFILLLSSLVLFLLILLLVPRFEGQFFFFVTAFLIVVGNVLFPVWFFQGIQQMKYITFLNISTRTLITISIFVFINDPSDYHLALFINTLSYFVPGVIGFIFVKIKFRVNFVIPNISELKATFSEGWHIFVSSFLGNIIASSSIFILGLTSTKEIVGIYSAIERIIRAMIGFFMPLTQALFPHVSAKFALSYTEGIAVVRKAGKYIIILAGVVSVIAISLAGLVIDLIYNDTIAQYTYIMQLLIIWFFISIINNIIGYQYLVASGQEKKYSKSFVVAAMVTLLLYIALSVKFSVNGIVSAMILGELVLTISMVFFIYKDPYIKNEAVKGK